MSNKGLAQIPLMIGFLLMALAVPVAVKLSQQVSDTRKGAAGCVDSNCNATCIKSGARAGRCAGDSCACVTMIPTVTPGPKCVPKPPCVDGILDPNTGTKIYCDPQPGTIFCIPTPTPGTPISGCTTEGSTCIIACPTWPPIPTCPPGGNCPQYSPPPPCTVQKGICQKNRCVPIATPTPTIRKIYCDGVMCPSGWDCVKETCPSVVNGGESIGCDPRPFCVITGTPTPTPKPRCTPRPACLDANPACEIMEPAEGFCLRPTPTPISDQKYCDVDGKCAAGFECVKPGPCPVINGQQTTCAFRPYCRKILVVTVAPTRKPTPTMKPLCKLWAKGDVDCNGIVNSADIRIWLTERSQYLKDAIGRVKGNYKSDINGDGVVDMSDFNILKKGYLEGLQN